MKRKIRKFWRHETTENGIQYDRTVYIYVYIYTHKRARADAHPCV